MAKLAGLEVLNAVIVSKEGRGLEHLGSEGKSTVFGHF